MAITVKLTTGPKGTGKPGLNTEKIVDATADVPGVRAICMAKATEVAGKSAANLATYNVVGTDAQKSRGEVQSEISVLPVQEFLRESDGMGGTIIPVALAISDDPASARWEYGSGRRIPMTRFMRKAVAAAGGIGWKPWVSR